MKIKYKFEPGIKECFYLPSEGEYFKANNEPFIYLRIKDKYGKKIFNMHDSYDYIYAFYLETGEIVYFSKDYPFNAFAPVYPKRIEGDTIYFEEKKHSI